MATISMLDSNVKLLGRLPLFADVPKDDLMQLAGQTRLDSYERDTVIFFQGDICERIYLVRSGRVKIVYHDEDGREVILEIISPGEAFGGGVLFFPTHPATAKAMEDATIASFPSQVFSQFLLNHPNVSLKLLHMLGARHLSMINMQTLAGERVERRMAHILHKLAKRLGRPEADGILITIPLSRQDLADMACTTLETAIRTVSRFNKEGLVATHRGGYLVVTDLEGLEKLTR
jgi:CRP/FNR family transcriptional regulator, cyclic AMP receptor protein